MNRGRVWDSMLHLTLAVIVTAGTDAEAQQVDAFELTIPELQDAMASGETTSAALVQQHLDRIAAFDRDGPRLNAMITINPRALEEAAELDRILIELTAADDSGEGANA